MLVRQQEKKYTASGKNSLSQTKITFKVKVLTSCNNTGFTLTLKVKIQDFESP